MNSSTRGTFSGHPELRGFGGRVRMYRREPDTLDLCAFVRGDKFGNCDGPSIASAADSACRQGGRQRRGTSLGFRCTSDLPFCTGSSGTTCRRRQVPVSACSAAVASTQAVPSRAPARFALRCPPRNPHSQSHRWRLECRATRSVAAAKIATRGQDPDEVRIHPARESDSCRGQWSRPPG